MSNETLLQDHITDNEITNKAYATVASISLGTVNHQIISQSITKRAGTRIRVEFSYVFQDGSGLATPAVGLQLRRGTTVIQNPFADNAFLANARVSCSAVFEDNIASAGTFNYNIFKPAGVTNRTGLNLVLRVLELLR